MNIFLSLDREEIEALMDFHADKIGKGDEAQSDRACKRIHQLERLLSPDLTSTEWQPAQELVA